MSVALQAASKSSASRIRRVLTSPVRALATLLTGMRRTTTAAPRRLRALVVGLATTATSFLGTLTGRSEYGRAFAGSSWLYTCVGLNAEAASKARWIVEARGSDGQWSADPRHDLNDLLEAPHEMLSWPDLVERALIDLQLAGNMLWLVLRDERRIHGIDPLWISKSVSVDVDPETGIPQRYRYVTWRGVAKESAAGDIVHAMLPNPDSIGWGLGRLPAAANAINTDASAASAQATTLENAHNPAGVLSIEAPEGIMGADQTEIETDFKERYSGPDNAGKMIVVNGARARYQRFSMTGEEMAYTDTRRATRDEIASVCRTPLPILGALEHATLQNARTLKEHWWHNGLLPLLLRVERAANLQMVRPIYGRDVRLRVDISTVPELLPALADRTAVGLDLQALKYTRDDINARLNFGMPQDAPYPDDDRSAQ